VVAEWVAAGLERRGALQWCFWLLRTAFGLVLEADKGLAVFARLGPAGNFFLAVGADFEYALVFGGFVHTSGLQTHRNGVYGESRVVGSGVELREEAGSSVHYGRHVEWWVVVGLLVVFV